MKDQVDNLEKAGIIDAVTINGLLDPIERANSFERVEDGRLIIVYLSRVITLKNNRTIDIRQEAVRFGY